MFYLAFILVGLLLTIFAAWLYRRTEKKGLPIALMAIGIVLLFVGVIFAVLISTGQLALPFN